MRGCITIINSKPHNPQFHAVTISQHSNTIFILSGFNNSNTDEAIVNDIVIRKRKSKENYHFPIKSSQTTKWSSEIDISNLDITNGLWDFYYQDEIGGLQRLAIKNDQIFNENDYFLTQLERLNSFEIHPYITINGYVTLSVKTAQMVFEHYSISAIDQSIIRLEGELRGLHSINPLYTEPLLLISNQETKELISAPIQLSNTNEDIQSHFLLKFDYKQILNNENSKKNRWGVYIKLFINEIHHVFRLTTNSAKLKVESNFEFETPILKHAFFYSTVNDNLSLTTEKTTIKRDLSKFKFENNVLELEGYAILNNVVITDTFPIDRHLIIKERITGTKINFQLANKNAITNYGDFKISIPINEINALSYERDSIYDLYIQINYKSHSFERKLGCSNFTYSRDGILSKVSSRIKLDYIINYLTYTPNGNLKILKFQHSWTKYLYLEFGQYVDCFLNKKDIWLIGERKDTAQDTGYHFFKYCRLIYPNKDIYYVIHKSSNDLYNLKGLGNVVYYGSFKHYRLAARATKLIGSHDLDYLFPTKGIELASYRKGKRIFLQHGVMGRKNVEYHKYYYEYPFNTFIVSSKYEKKLVKENLGYQDDEIIITGLSRFDNLLENNSNNNAIIIIPTWREWLGNEDTFEDSDYFRHYNNLLTDERLQAILEKYSVHLNFYPHYRMQPLIKHFKNINSDNISIIQLGEKNVQDLLKENSLMITDYSSVSFDFNYMSKPVLFYHFDSEKFFKNGILRPFEETFLGKIIEDKDLLVDEIERYINSGFKEDKAVNDKKGLVFDHIDTNNSKRIFDEITKL